MKKLSLILILLVGALLLFPVDAHAAQIALTLVGAAVGFLVGGPAGLMIGAFAGSMLGGLLFPPKGPDIVGPRITDKTVQSAAYGSHVIKTWGKDRVPAQVIFSSGLLETKHETEVGGKGFGGGATSTTFTYAVDIMLSFGEEAKGFLRLWADTKLIFDATGTVQIKKRWLKEGRKFVVRDGNEDQLPSALEESYHGVGQCSAHRGLFCLEAENFQLADFANRIPNFTAEIFTEGDSDFTMIESYDTPPTNAWFSSWGYIDPLGDIWSLNWAPGAPYWYPSQYTKVFHWTLATPTAPVEEPHPLWSGSVVQEASLAGGVPLRSDEPSAAVFATNSQNVWMSYFLLEEGTRVDILGPVAGIPHRAVKYGDDMYVLGGASEVHLYHFNSAGAPINDSGVFETGGVRDMGRSENFLFAMRLNEILKVDADTLALVSTIDISNIDNPLAIAVVSDTEIRIVSSVSGFGTRFWISTDGGVPVLDLFDPNTSQVATDYHFALRWVNSTYVFSSDGAWGGFESFIWFYGINPNPEDIPLWKVVRDINLRAGLDSVVSASPPTVGDIEVSDLLDSVHGYSITRRMTARDALVQLQQAYFFDAREKDFKLEYVKRGRAPVKSIPGSDLAVRTSITEKLPDRLMQSRGYEAELPLRIHIIYPNLEASYQPGHEYAPRLITDARATITIEVTCALTSSEARRIVDAHLAVAHLERDTFGVTVSRKNLLIDACDNVNVIITEE